MISEALGLLLGQIAILSMQRFFKALPRPWIQNYVHPFIQQFLRCNIPPDIVYHNRTQSESIGVPISSSTCQQFQRFHMQMQIVIDSINEALLKLHSYDRQLLRFEETFIGSAIVLFIIFALLLTLLLWLRRLSQILPKGIPQNNKRYEQKYNYSKEKETFQEVSVPQSFASVKFTSNSANLGGKGKKLSKKSQSNSAIDKPSLKPEINLSNDSINPKMQTPGEREKAIVDLHGFQATAVNHDELKDQINSANTIAIRSKPHIEHNKEYFCSRKRRETYKTNLSNSLSNRSDRIFGEVKRQRYILISLFLSDESLNKDNFHPSMKVHSAKTVERRKRHFRRIL